MTLEQRLAEALREVDAYEPSPDLFVRVERSLDEDHAHRRRVGVAWLSAMASLSAIVVYLGLLASRSDSGQLVIPIWAMALIENVILAALVFLLAPVIRRFGGFYVADVFHLDPETGIRFLRLLDLAYYLVFGGVILIGMSIGGLDGSEDLGTSLQSAAGRIAVLLLLIGGLHALNLLAMPFVGLVFSSTVRRAARARAGAAAPAESAAAARVDRIAATIVWVLAALVAIGALIGTGIVIGAGLG